MNKADITQHICRQFNPNLICEFRVNYTIAGVTYSMRRAARLSQRAACFHLRQLDEAGDTNQVFADPPYKLTRNYITSRFGRAAGGAGMRPG